MALEKITFDNFCHLHPGVDLSKILGADQNIGGRQRVVITDENMGISQLLGCGGGDALTVPKVFAYHAFASVGYITASPLSAQDFLLLQVANYIIGQPIRA